MKPAVVLLLSICCVAHLYSTAQSTQQKCEAAVKKYFSNLIPDPDAYRPMEFTPIKTAYTNYKMTAYFGLNMLLIEQKKKLAEDYLQLKQVDKWQQLKIDALHEEDSLHAWGSKYKPVLYGWKLDHKFRFKDAITGWQFETYTMYIDKNFKALPEIAVTVPNK